MASKNTLKKWGVGLKNKDKKEKEQIKKTKFSDIDLFEEGHEEEPDELDLIDGLIKDPATTQDKEHNAYLRLMHEYKAEYAKREKCIKVGILLIIISAVDNLHYFGYCGNDTDRLPLLQVRKDTRH